MHDPKTYSDPLAFKPERFIATDNKPAEQDPHTIAFGFGRRTCPGMHIADASIFLSVSNILATLDISKALDANGKEIEPVVDYSSGGISHPKPFQCKVVPRSARAEALIRS